MVQTEEAAAASITTAGGDVPALCQPPTAQDHLAISTAALFTQHHHFKISLAIRQTGASYLHRKLGLKGQGRRRAEHSIIDDLHGAEPHSELGLCGRRGLPPRAFATLSTQSTQGMK